MCGIAGVFGKKDKGTETIKVMLNCLIHRGPDDEHIVEGDDFVLGARRLSIVDVGGGRQPIANETKTIWAAQNGELYNFPQVRPLLLARGHHLFTECDTEIIPHLYEDYGARFPEQIDGMFAIAVWDDARKTGLLARDRIGKKPIYYHQRGKALYFASEIKALLKIPGFERRINYEALHHYLSYKHIPHPLSIFKDIFILPPAHRLVFQPGKELDIQRYWDLDFSPNPETADLPEEELIEQFLNLLRSGVEKRLMSDVPIGFFLSGGIDSSLSTALAAELSSTKIKTFTLAYADGSTTAGKEQDRRWANWVAAKYNTEHYEETVEFTSFPDNIRQIIACFDEPFAGVLSTYYLSQRISRHVKVALSGDGADELFGSYRSHRLAFPIANFTQYLSTHDTDLIRPFEDQVDYLSSMVEKQDWAWRSKLFVFSEEEKQKLYSPEFVDQMYNYSTRQLLRHSFDNLTAQDPLNRILEVEFRTTFPDQVLTFVDRLSMVHSLEVRTAYLDTDLVNFVTRLPGRLKIKDGETKYLLKQAALRYFPNEMVFREKEGFLMPVTEWILHDLQDYVHDTLSIERLKQHGIFNYRHVSQLVDQIYNTDADYTQVNKVLELIIFQEWFEMYRPCLTT